MYLRLKRMLALLLAAVMIPAALAMGEEAVQEQVIIYFQDGSRVRIPAGIANDEQALKDYCSTYFPGRAYTKTKTDGFSFDTTIAEELAVSRYGEGTRALSVRLVKLGLHTTVVANLQSEELTVPTRFLTIRGNSDMAHHVAIISAPRTGEASLRDQADGSSKVIATCKAGRIVAVLAYTNASLTKILYDGQEGYIRTDCLIFDDGQTPPMGTAVVHIKNVTDGKSTVPVRAGASKSTAKVADLSTGTEVLAHGLEEGWYAIEFDGWYGYIPAENLRMREE